MPSSNFSQSSRILSCILTVLLVYSLQGSVVQTAAKNNTSLRLLDVNTNPIAHVHVTALRTSTHSPQSSGYTSLDGITSLELTPGEYYFTGDISELKNRAPYAADVKNLKMTTLYFISKPFIISNSSGLIDLTIDSKSYINLVDIAGVKGFHVHISQEDLGIETTVRINANHNWLRLYLPTRLQYTIQKADGFLPMQWPIYAAPGLQFTFSP
jgi:hypothetical protein